MQAVIPPPAAMPADKALQPGPGQAMERPTAQIPGHPQLAALQQPQLQAAMLERQLAARRQAQLAVQQAAQQAAEQVLLFTFPSLSRPSQQDKTCWIGGPPTHSFPVKIVLQFCLGISCPCKLASCRLICGVSLRMLILSILPKSLTNVHSHRLQWLCTFYELQSDMFAG